MDEQVGDSVATERFQALVLTSFGATALLLALLGVYGVLVYSVSLRQQEFGIRIALGSGKAALMRLVLRQAALPVLLGAVSGCRWRSWRYAGCAASCIKHRPWTRWLSAEAWYYFWLQRRWQQCCPPAARPQLIPCKR